MKKIGKKQLDNRGAALVTILIAVTFMTIMASSLIYMAYMNYLTKSMRYSSTDNFYTDEFALDELSTALQQTAANESTIAAARTAITTAVGKTSINGHNAYTESSVENLINLASQEASISVNCAYMQNGNLTKDSLEEGSDYIKLRGVMITATTQEGYQSTITSDITIYFPNVVPGTMDINDFSVLTDSPVVYEKGGSHYYSGNMFIQAPSGGTALKVDNGTVVGLLSPQAMVVGDIEVKGNSILHVTGTLIVYGEITVEEGSTLICSGELMHEGLQNDGEVKGISGIHSGYNAGQTLEKSEYFDTLPEGTGVVGSLFRDVKVWGSVGPDSDPYQWHDFSLDLYGQYQNDMFTLSGHSSGVQTHIWGQEQTINTGDSYENALILSTKDITYNVSLSFPNTTIMTTGSIDYLTTQGTSYMSKMSDEAFETAKNYLFCPPGTQFNPDDGTGNHPNTRIYFASGTTADYDLGDFPNENKTTVDGYTFAHGDGSQPMNYLPVYYFLVEDTSTIISELFAVPTGSPNPKNSTIIYELWSKD